MKSNCHNRNHNPYRLVCFLAIFLFNTSFAALAQIATGTPPFGTAQGGSFDSVNLANLNVHFEIPVINKSGVGIPFTFKLGYDSSVWFPVNRPGIPPGQSWKSATYWGWQEEGTGVSQHLYYTSVRCDPNISNYTYSNFLFYDNQGTLHHFDGQMSDCPPGPNTIKVTAKDGSGYTLVGKGSRSEFYVFHPSGVNFHDGADFTGATSDTNGNTATNPDFVRGQPGPTTSQYYQVSSPTAARVQYKFTLSDPLNIWTNFGVPGIDEFRLAGTYMIGSFVKPDGSSYRFTYEPTPAGSDCPATNGYTCVTGRIASVTLPTGGRISYSYSGGSNGILPDGSTAGLTRTVFDGVNTAIWRYSRNGNQTTVTDPDGNATVYTFSNGIEIERVLYQGAQSSGTIVQTIVTCYNGTAPSGMDWSPCINASVTPPITARATYTILPNGGTQFFQWSAVINTFNQYGLATESDVYDWTTTATAPLLRKTVTSYATFTMPCIFPFVFPCLAVDGIVDHPSSVIVKDGSDRVVAQTNFVYDEASSLFDPASNTTWSPDPNAPRGNLTTVSRWVQGSSYLSEHFTYTSQGLPHTATDVNGAKTTYNYPDYTSTCSYAFPRSVTFPTINGVTMTQSMTWDCGGMVATQTTDLNGWPLKTLYTDRFFWRPTAIQDLQSNSQVDLSYPSAAPFTWIESSFVFNGGSSIQGLRTTVDGLGRPSMKQIKQSPSSGSLYESTQTSYDIDGRASQTTTPYLAGPGGAGGTPGAFTTYDQFSRPKQLRNAGGGVLTYDYYYNDVLVTAGPAAPGENAKQTQYEYDALGRLTSVCEVTNAQGSGTCGQFRGKTGYWTRYQHDAAGRLTGICQYTTVPLGTDCVQYSSANQQTRVFTHDGLGRMTREQEPETGTTQYAYDSDAACAAPSSGDLIKTVDNAGNVTCYSYDLFHRPTAVLYSGPQGATTPGKYFVYDNATVNGQTMQNAKGRMVEAYTSTDGINKITDEGFSYSQRGDLTDIYESTAHSGGYYHTALSYYPHGAPQTLSSSYGLPTLSYGSLDGQGRITQVTASSGQNPVTTVSYNTSSQPLGVLTQVNLGSGDSDSFGFDADTGRMTQYKFTVGAPSSAQSVIGNLTWNPNGSLGGLNITDPLNPANSQNCVYSQDDLRRTSSATCNSNPPQDQPLWSQTFNYDPFGNISKNGSLYFYPSYVAATNQFVSDASGTVGPNYDANGNLTNDTMHRYQWDAEGHVTAIDSVSLTYDALGRLVERAYDQGCAPIYRQVVYGPDGSKLALMSGQIIRKAFVPLPGGVTAIYGSPIVNNVASLIYYRHSDWLGSTRVTTSPTQQWLYDGAYAPFGEPYVQAVANGGSVDRAFAGHSDDTTFGLDDATFRDYAAAQQGRWISPDPLGIGAANLSDPQTLNLYAYAANRPLTSVDPDGLDFVNATLIWWGGGGGGGGWFGYWGGWAYANPWSFGQGGYGGYVPVMGYVPPIRTGPQPANNGCGARCNLNPPGWIPPPTPPLVYSGGGYPGEPLPNGDVRVGLDIWHVPGFDWRVTGQVATVKFALLWYTSAASAAELLPVAGEDLIITGIEEGGAETFGAIGSTGRVGEEWLAENLGGDSQIGFETTQGDRYVDQLSNGIANESKVGYQSLTSKIRLQIAKDVELRNTGAVNNVVWHFFRSPVTGLGGPSKPLLRALVRAGIKVVIR